MKKLDQLTFTRFIAAFTVLLFHGGKEVFPFYLFPLDPLLTAGQTAVSYFFVLSGFVMALAYYRPAKRFDLRSYAAARFSRIYPVYILAFVLTCVYYLDVMSRVKSPKIWANVLLYQAWIPKYSQSFNMAAWSLSVEAFFYLLFPLLAIGLMRLSVRRVVRLSVGFWVLSQVIHSLLYTAMMPGAHLLLDYFPLFHLNAFVLGVAGGIWYLSEPHRTTLTPLANRAWLLLALGLVGAALIGRRFIPAMSRNFTLDAGLLAPFFLVIILFLALDSGRLSRWFSHPALVLLGDASYALYILHVPMRWLAERGLSMAGIPLSFPVMQAIYMPLMILLSVLVFLRIERPARDWLHLNMSKVPLIVLDLGLISAAVWLSFVLRLGAGRADFPFAQTFALRAALVVYFLALVVFGLYGTTRPSWKSLIPAILLGGAALAALMYLAFVSGWVEGFPRTVLALNAALTFVLIFGSRLLLRLRRTRPGFVKEQA